jgi:YVTN family beta-propeller protein
MRGLLILALATLLVGCGGSDDDANETTASALPVATATTPATVPSETPTSMPVGQAASPTAPSATRTATSTALPQPSPTATDAVPTPIVAGSPATGLPVAGQVTATIPVGVSPLAVAVGHGAIWVYNDMDGTLSRIDPATNAVVATIPIATPLESVPPELLGERQSSPDLAIDASSVWVNKPEEQAVVQVDPRTNTVVATIALDADPFSIAVDGSSLWVSLFTTASVARIDTTTGEVVATVSDVSSPAGVAVQQDAVWVTNYFNDTVTRIDPQTNQVVARISTHWSGAPLTGAQCSLCASEILANNDGVWVTMRFADAIVRIDPATNRLAAIIPVGVQPRSLASDARGVWVGMQSSAGLFLIDPEANQVVAAAPATDAPNQFAWIALSENTIWVARASTNDVVRIDLQPD